MLFNSTSVSWKRNIGLLTKRGSRRLDNGQVLFFLFYFFIIIVFLLLRVHVPRRSQWPKTRKKGTRPMSSKLDRTILVDDKSFNIWDKRTPKTERRAWNKRVIPSRQDSAMSRPRGVGGGYSQKNWVGVCGPLSKTPAYPIYDQNLQYSLPYLWSDQKFETQFMTRLSHQNPVSDLHFN